MNKALGLAQGRFLHDLQTTFSCRHETTFLKRTPPSYIEHLQPQVEALKLKLARILLDTESNLLAPITVFDIWNVVFMLADVLKRRLPT